MKINYIGNHKWVAADPNLLHLPTELKRLSAWIGEREWNGEMVAQHHYDALDAMRGKIKSGVEYEPRF